MKIKKEYKENNYSINSKKCNDMARIWVKGHWKVIIDRNRRRRRIWVPGYWKEVDSRFFPRFRW